MQGRERALWTESGETLRNEYYCGVWEQQGDLGKGGDQISEGWETEGRDCRKASLLGLGACSCVRVWNSE